jgi:H+/gluconate symporter-like permease
MGRILLGLSVTCMLAGSAMSDIAPPKTKPTATKPKLETETVPTPFSGTAILAGVAMSLAVVSGGLVLMRRRQPRTTVEM